MTIDIVDSDFREIEIPSVYETFEAQVLTITIPRKEALSPYMMPRGLETRRVVLSGRYRIEIVEATAYSGGKPTLIIHEEKPKDEA